MSYEHFINKNKISMDFCHLSRITFLVEKSHRFDILHRDYRPTQCAMHQALETNQTFIIR